MSEIPPEDTCSGRVSKIKKGTGNTLLALLGIAIFVGFPTLIVFGVISFFNECRVDGHSIVYCVFETFGTAFD